MTTAQARVEQRVIITGVDDASAAIKKVKDSLAGMDKQAVKTQQSLAEVDPSKQIRETSGDVESALKGLSDFAGGASQEVSKVGDAFGAVEAVTRLIPGPIGLIVTGITAAGVASVLLFNLWKQNEAKLSLLTDPQTRTLGESLGFSADQTVKLQGALDNLTTSARPPQAALAQVAANAEAIGGDPADAVVKFIAAWERGPEAVKALRTEIGNVTASLQQLPDVAKSLGLDPVKLGLSEATTKAQELKKTFEDVRDTRAEISTLEAKIEQAVNATEKGTVKQRLAALDQLQAIREDAEFQIRTKNQIVRLDEASADRMANQLTLSKDAQNVLQQTAQNQQDADLLAQLAGDKKVASSIRLDALDEKRADLLAQQAKLLADQSATGTGLVADALRLLNLEIQRTDIAAKAIKDADAAEKKAKAKEAASKAKAKRDKELAEANKIAEGRVRLAIEAADAEAKAFDEVVDREQAGNDLRAANAKAAADAITQTQLLELEGNAAIQDALGNSAKAADLRQQADNKRRDAEIAKIEEVIAAKRREAGLLGVDGADIERERLAALDAVQIEYAEKRRKRDEEEEAKRLQRIADEGRKVAEVLASAGGTLSGFGGKAGKVGQALGSIGQGVGAVTSNWGDLKGAAPGVINAVGGVATAFVDSEKSKAVVLALMEGAHAVASFATGDYVGAASHGVAAALYAGVAGGVIGGASGSTGPGASSAPALGAGGGGGTGTGGGTGGGGALVQNVTFTGLFATKQQVGQALQQTSRSLRKTGLQTVKGV